MRILLATNNNRRRRHHRCCQKKHTHKRMEDNVNYYLHSTSPWTSNYKSCLLFLSGFRFLYNSKWIKSPLIIEIQCETIERIQRKKKKKKQRPANESERPGKIGQRIFGAFKLVCLTLCIVLNFYFFLHNTNTSAIHMFISYVCELSVSQCEIEKNTQFASFNRVTIGNFQHFYAYWIIQ